jgi:hypothetical protein
MRQKAEKFRGSFFDVADMLNQALKGHEQHPFTLSIDSDDPDFCALYCHACSEPVISGSRDLIELVWLDFVSGPPRSH